MDSRIATRDWIRNDACDLVKRDEINTESPNEVLDVGDVLLMRFWCEQGFEEPGSIMDLANVAELFEFSNAITHDGDFTRAVVDLPDGDWSGIASINDTLVIFDGDEQALIVEHRPILLDEGEDLRLDAGV